MDNKLKEIEQRIQHALDTQTTVLDLSALQITEDVLSKYIEQLTPFTGLQLSSNLLTTLPESIGKLAQLKELYLRDNRLTKLPESIGQLTQLTAIYLENNKLTTLPNSISQLTQLTLIHLNSNRLTTFPEGITNLTKLTGLSLCDNRLSSIPESISNFKNLDTLYLNGNRLTELPESIGQLGVYGLNLGNNQLTTLPESITLDARLDFLILEHNQLTTPPQHIAEQGIVAIRNYFKQGSEHGFVTSRQLKIQIVGNPMAGKTTLFNLLVKVLDNSFEEIPTGTNDRTYGVNVYRRWSIVLTNSNTLYSANLWDFGGQKIQYMTHQFLLSEKALFILVLDHEKVEDNTDYWFQFLELLDQHSTIMVVINQKSHIESPEIFDLKLYADIYKNKRIKKIELDLKNGNDNKRSSFVDDFVDEIVNIQYDPLPAPWPKIEQELLLLKENYLSLSEFEAFCETKEVLGDFVITDPDDKTHFLHDYLRVMGSVIYYPIGSLRNYVFLKPEWIANAIYHIFKQKTIKENQGRVSIKWLKQTWADKHNEDGSRCYSNTDINLFIELLLKDHFDVCYELPDGETLIMPMWLPKVKPPFKLFEKNLLHFRYEYKCLPFGLISHLIVHFYDGLYSENGITLNWRNGFVLKQCEGNHCAYAVVERIKIENTQRLDIITHGDLRLRKNIMTEITGQIERLHQRFKISSKPDWVATTAACYGCIEDKKEPQFHRIDKLLQERWRNDLGVYNKPITCMGCGKNVVPEKLLGGYDIDTPTPEDTFDKMITRARRIKQLFFPKAYIRWGGVLIFAGITFSGAPWWVPFIIEWAKILGWNVTSFQAIIDSSPYIAIIFAVLGASLILIGMAIEKR